MSINPFHDLATTWWDSEGPFRTLHDINPIRLSYIQQYINLSGLNVLDLGCGGGLLAESLAKQGAHVSGVDIEPSLIEVAKLHAKQENLNIDYQVSDITNFKHKKFDAIVCMEMLEHVQEPEQIIKACHRLLKPKGYLFLSTINRSLKAYVELILLGEYVLKLLPRQTHDYQYFIKPAEMLNYLTHHHFKLKNIAGMGYQPFSRKAQIIKSVDVNYLICAQKND
jgi:2-polyprenyl-6-hydroxyphenyl methylase/3-demethylubiquinone-9 3-methyltransferase